MNVQFFKFLLIQMLMRVAPLTVRKCALQSWQWHVCTGAWLHGWVMMQMFVGNSYLRPFALQFWGNGSKFWVPSVKLDWYFDHLFCCLSQHVSGKCFLFFFFFFFEEHSRQFCSITGSHIVKICQLILLIFMVKSEK